MSDIYKSLGRQIRARRLALDLSQEHLAARVELTRTSIANLEAGRQRIRVDTLLDLAAALGVSVVDLLPPSVINRPDSIEPGLMDGTTPSEKDWIMKVVSGGPP